MKSLVYHGLFVYHPAFLIEIATLDKPHDWFFPLSEVNEDSAFHSP